MKVGIDARHARLGLGIGVFVRELCAELVDLPGTEVVWFGRPASAPPGVVSSCDVSRLPYPLLDSSFGRRIVARSGADVFHFTGNTGWSRPSPLPTVLTVHDLIFTRSQTHARSLRQVVGHRYARLNIRAAIRCASRVVVPSHLTCENVVSTFGPSPRPAVIPQGVKRPEGHGFSEPSDAGKGPYIVAFSARDPRKNLSLMLQALRSRDCPDLRLRLLAGAGVPDGWMREAEPELKTGRIELLDYLPREQMWSILAGAVALVYPSSDEGFGLPVIEAMAVGVPVVTGLAPVTREIGGSAIAEIDKDSPAESIATALGSIAANPEVRREMVDRGLAQAAEFTWQKTAQRYRAVYTEVLA